MEEPILMLSLTPTRCSRLIAARLMAARLLAARLFTARLFAARLFAARALPPVLLIAMLATLPVRAATPDVPLPPCAAAPAPAEPAAKDSTAPTPPVGAADAASPADPTNPAAPRARLDPEQDADRGSLWTRLRGGLVMSDLEGERVTKWEQFYARQPDYVQRMVGRGGRYLYHIVEEIERRQMPAELALLPFIESAFNPQAQSHARASGMWQFMPATGKDFDLRQNLFRDDRRDVLASTRAALDYLKRLHSLFDDWHLALAAYNWGQGNVMRAIASNQRAGKATDYASLKMPEETRDYVPKLQAIKNMVLAPERLGLSLPELANHPYFLSVPIERDMDVALAARLAGMPLEDFQALNPQMNKPVILAAGVPQVLLPYDNANRFLTELPLVKGPLASWTAWTAPRTLQPAEAARLVGMPEAELRDVNRIPARMLLKAGSTLLVPRHAHTTADVTEHLADNATMQLTPEGRALRKVSFKAGKGGDSVAAVAKRYRVSAAQVAQWNQVAATAHFKPGQAVVVMQAAPAPKKAGAPAAKRKAAKAPEPRKAPAKTPARKRNP
jgi:membrane-bound lytic murein transglycosylase D